MLCYSLVNSKQNLKRQNVLHFKSSFQSKMKKIKQNMFYVVSHFASLIPQLCFRGYHYPRVMHIPLDFNYFFMSSCCLLHSCNYLSWENCRKHSFQPRINISSLVIFATLTHTSSSMWSFLKQQSARDKKKLVIHTKLIPFYIFNLFISSF